MRAASKSVRYVPFDLWPRKSSSPSGVLLFQMVGWKTGWVARVGGGIGVLLRRYRNSMEDRTRSWG